MTTDIWDETDHGFVVADHFTNRCPRWTVYTCHWGQGTANVHKINSIMTSCPRYHVVAMVTDQWWKVNDSCFEKRKTKKSDHLRQVTGLTVRIWDHNWARMLDLTCQKCPPDKFGLTVLIIDEKRTLNLFQRFMKHVTCWPVTDETDSCGQAEDVGHLRFLMILRSDFT